MQRVLYTALSDHRSRHPRAGQASVIGGEGQSRAASMPSSSSLATARAS
jgi:hypothetical protein